MSARVCYLRGGREVRSFSPSEDELITKWRIEGYGTTAIARSLFTLTGYFRTPATINMRLKILANRDETGAGQ